MLKNYYCRIAVIMWAIFTISSQRYDTSFNYQLPQQKQILTLEKYVNQTSICIDTSPQHFTFLFNEPYQKIQNLLAVNITYSLADGLQSEWTEKKQNEQSLHIFLNNTEKIHEQAAKSPISCKTTSPQIVFSNDSSFLIQNDTKIVSSKVITKYEELLHEQNAVLDVWKSPINNYSSRLTFILLSSGELIVIKSYKNANGQLEHKQESHKLANELRDEEINDQRYVKEGKLYVVGDGVQIEVKIESQEEQSSQYSIQKIEIKFKYPNETLVDFEWVDNQNSEPYLAILTPTRMCLYQFSPVNQAYHPLQNAEFGKNQISQYLHVSSQFFTKQNGRQGLNFKKAFYLKQHKSFILWQNNFGMIACSFNPNNTFTVFAVLASFIDCYDIQKTPHDQHSQLQNQINFIYNCKNYLGRLQVQINKNKMTTSRSTFDGFYVPAGEIVLEPSPEGNLILVMGQTKVAAFRSWKYPKILEVEDPYVDGLYMFGSEYLSVTDGKVTVGNFQIVHEKVVCMVNEKYRNTSESLQKVDDTTLPAQQNPAILIEYIAECNTQVLSQFPYSYKQQQFGSKQYCRYKKVYPNVCLVTDSIQQTKTSSQKMEGILLVVFVFCAIMLLVGVGIWLLQKRKISAFLEEEGMPVGSEDLEANPTDHNNLNHKLY